MTIHVGEMTSTVEVAGLPSGGQQDGGKAAELPEWAGRLRFAELAEERERARARTAGGGFDG